MEGGEEQGALRDHPPRLDAEGAGGNGHGKRPDGDARVECPCEHARGDHYHAANAESSRGDHRHHDARTDHRMQSRLTQNQQDEHHRREQRGARNHLRGDVLADLAHGGKRCDGRTEDRRAHDDEQFVRQPAEVGDRASEHEAAFAGAKREDVAEAEQGNDDGHRLQPAPAKSERRRDDCADHEEHRPHQRGRAGPRSRESPPSRASA